MVPTRAPGGDDNRGMFTGIVSGIGRIVASESLGSDAGFGTGLTIEAPAGYLDGVAIGDSIALAGACMTVVWLDAASSRFRVEVSAESRARTTGLGTAGEVNLEKALRAGDRLDGHLVSGHVDGTGAVTAFERVGESWRLQVAAPPTLARFLALKGSVAVDGVSLTVNAVEDRAEGRAGGGPMPCEFSVNLIPHTVARTTLRNLAPGREVNLEVDTIARYVERMLATA